MNLPQEILDMAHFFSPLAECPSRVLPFHRLALFGACPPSSPLHLALAVAQQQQRRTSQHPQQFDSTNVNGSSLKSSTKHVLILCTSRASFFEGLVLENEEYLAVNGGDPSIASILQDNVEVKFLSTMAQWNFFCSALSLSSSSKEAIYAPGSLEAKSLNLQHPPDLVIVSGLSLFLSESRNAGAGIETYASLVANTLAAFPPSAAFVFFDDPPDQYISLPLLPFQHRTKLRQIEKEKQRQTTLPGTNIGNGSDTSPQQAHQQPVSEGRTLELRRIMEYFCDGIGGISAEGGTEDVLWYEISVKSTSGSSATGAIAREKEPAWTDLERRYAVYKGYDDVGYSGRERWSVRFT